MNEIIVVLLLVTGSGFILVAALGLVRMPDVFTRLSCNAKAATLGFGLLLLALAVYFHELGVSSRAVATIGFIILTTPVASHRIGRAAYLDGANLWAGTILDELKGRYSGIETSAERLSAGQSGPQEEKKEG